jgi:hypothetical protein
LLNRVGKLILKKLENVIIWLMVLV